MASAAPAQEAASQQSSYLSQEASAASPNEAPTTAVPVAGAVSIVGSNAGPAAELTTVGSTAGTVIASNAAEAPAKSGADSSLPARRGSTAEGAGADADMDEPIDVAKFGSAAELEALGLERLKRALQAQGLKCGGSLADRAARLFLLKDTPREKLDKKHLAKPAGVRKA